MKINVKLMGKFFAVLLLFAVALSVVPGVVDAAQNPGDTCSLPANPCTGAGLECNAAVGKCVYSSALGIDGEFCTNSNQCGKVGDKQLICSNGLCIGENLPKPFTTLGSLLAFINRMLNIVFAVLLTFVVIMLVWGSLEFVTSAGDEKKVSAARQKMLYAVLGLVLALVAAGIPPLVRSIIGA